MVKKGYNVSSLSERRRLEFQAELIDQKSPMETKRKERELELEKTRMEMEMRVKKLQAEIAELQSKRAIRSSNGAYK